MRLAAILLFLLVAGVVALLVACPPSPKTITATTSPGSSPPAVGAPLPSAPSSSAAGVPAERTTTVPIHPQPSQQALLAVIIDDAGYNLSELDAFLSLPGPLTIAVLPNLPNSTEAAHRVIAAGKDLILHCPMEPEGAENPGPGALYTGFSPEKIDALLDAMFASVPGAVGMNNHMGSRATQDGPLMTEVLRYLKEHGKFFVDSRTTANTVGPRISVELRLPFLERTAFLDDIPTDAEVGAAFETGAARAKDSGSAVVIGHVQNAAMLDILRARSSGLAVLGVRLARLSEVMKQREAEIAR
jgi:uncharacterized protein